MKTSADWGVCSWQAEQGKKQKAEKKGQEGRQAWEKEKEKMLKHRAGLERQLVESNRTAKRLASAEARLAEKDKAVARLEKQLKDLAKEKDAAMELLLQQMKSLAKEKEAALKEAASTSVSKVLFLFLVYVGLETCFKLM